ncbi:phenylacetate--CoA ligase family protein [Microcoleus sp. LEGE 07076]|uniref:phenylacetate--CoA ligase family protein n=1 Tax=Microcoleus sp. LEGE 07076 TaxID=915322 RepID=UPI001882D798|nr:phenylacetate--CoA ligase family protein [Microcoleus sp. LEGE 07076]MBE9186921.1 phenylacetate--CoA ligase family protein [Microcoleus sp. LEGE 07076]
MIELSDRTAIKLKRVLQIALTVPGNYHRFLQAGLIDSPSGLKQLVPDWQTAFSNLQPIAKQTVRQNPGLFLASVDDLVYRGMTSGTSGDFFTYFAGNEWNEARLLARKRALGWWGIDEQVPIINLASRLQPLRVNDIALIGNITPDWLENLKQLLQIKPAVIRGYPSRLSEVAAALVGHSIPAVLGVICTGEILFEFQKQLLESVFKASVINEYGCQETGISGLSCPEYGRLHLDVDRCLYEIIDGELVTTDLFNYTMPLIRYKCGDRLQLSSDACGCGRSQITAKILGRSQEQIKTQQGWKYPGEICLPKFPGIFNYQIVRQNQAEVDIWVQVEPQQVLDLSPLQLWLENLLGQVEGRVIVDSSDLSQLENVQSCSDIEWIEWVTKKSWGEWLKSGLLPVGEAREIALLLKSLIQPTAMVNSGISPLAKQHIARLLQRSTCRELAVELMAVRVLLFACSFLADRPTRQNIYRHAQQRLAEMNCREYSAIVDLLIPSLGFDNNTARSIWENTNLPDAGKLDVLNIQHLLAAFNLAANQAKRENPNIAIAWKPILSILIGDLNFWASRFQIQILASWCELVNPKTFTPSINHRQTTGDRFLDAWLTWRQSILGDSLATAALSQLQATATLPTELARAELEQGYAKLLWQEPLNPVEWLDKIKYHAGLISANLPDRDIDPIPWMPILLKLSKLWLAEGESELAYQCLITTAPPDMRASAFERLAREMNYKQSVICDRT